jgi:hypothetical protein
MNKSASEGTIESISPNHTMSLDEARKVMWLRNNFRPLGELLDEGYLNQARLEWASTKAFDPRLKQAAQVLLELLKQSSSKKATDDKEVKKPSAPSDKPLPVAMTIEQARATLWPLKPYEGQPMGPLVETRQITLKDLGYAIENAWEERVRKAAIALLLVRLKQVIQEPPLPAGFLHVVSSGRSHSERRQFQLTLLEGLIFGIALTSLIFATILSLQAQQTATSSSKALPDLLASPTGILTLFIVLAVYVGVGLLFNFIFARMMNTIDKQIENYRKGQGGEDKVVDVIRQSLDGNWFLFRNIVLPGRNKSDLDIVVIGPSGVWVMEIKTFTGEYRNIGEHWEYHSGNRWKLTKASPSRQAQNNAARFGNFLRAEDIKQWVTPVVVWANRESHLTVENPSTAVWLLDRLPDELGNIWHDETISEVKRKQIVEKLTKLSQERK